jgi:hypothetical protein
MHSRWLFALGIGTGVLLSGLAGSSHGVALGSALLQDKRLDAAGTPARARAPAAPSRLGGTPGPSTPPLPDDEDTYSAARYAQRRALDDAFRGASGEARDEAWAGAMEKSLELALDQVVAMAPVAVGKPDCRTQHCQVDLAWADRDAALAAASRVLAMLPGDCARTITHADDEQDDYDTYKSRILLDCPRSADAQR